METSVEPRLHAAVHTTCERASEKFRSVSSYIIVSL